MASFFRSSMSFFRFLKYLQHCLSLQLVVQLKRASPLLAWSCPHPPPPLAPSSLFIFCILLKPALPTFSWHLHVAFPLAPTRKISSLSRWFYQCSWVFLIYWKHNKSTMLLIKSTHPYSQQLFPRLNHSLYKVERGVLLPSLSSLLPPL